jgi:MoaA/NifB/PqqE/SkfB family radical SAM enzyme
MPFVEFAKRFGEQRTELHYRSPAVVVLEFGGGSCNKAGTPSCADFCNVPQGRIYNPNLDPPIEELAKSFPQIAKLKPAVVSLVPNGESIDTKQKSNTDWDTIFRLRDAGSITIQQFNALDAFYVNQYMFPFVRRNQKMTLAEKIALVLAVGKKSNLNVSLTTNGNYLNRDLLKLYNRMGLEAINLSYHPNSPFNPDKDDPTLNHLIARAQEAIEADVIPTITHVLTSQNAETFIALCDYVTEHDIFFSVGIATARGTDNFSNSKNKWIEPTDKQVKMVFRRLLARKLFADRHIRTSVPYLLVGPYVKDTWVCDQGTDFFHMNYQFSNGKWELKLNVCSEVRPDDDAKLQDFLVEGKMDAAQYLSWRKEAMNNDVAGCKTCIHQCWFEAEARGGIDIGKANPFADIELWDYWDTSGKAMRQRHTFKHPIRPTVSDKKDFQKEYLWETLLQGIARELAKIGENDYWQRTFKRSGINFTEILESCLRDASDFNTIADLLETEKKDMKLHNWHDAEYFQSKALRKIYLHMQKSGKEAGIAVPLKFIHVLYHQSPDSFSQKIKSVINRSKSVHIEKDQGIIYPIIQRVIRWIFGNNSRYTFRIFNSVIWNS